MSFSRVVAVAVPAALVTAGVALLLDAWRAMKADRASPFAVTSQSALEATYLEQLVPTESEVREEPLLAKATAHTTSGVVVASESFLTKPQLATFDANVRAVADFAQRHRKCVRLDAAALCSVHLIARAVSLLQKCHIPDQVNNAPGEGRPVLSGLVCRGASELLMWATRLRRELPHLEASPQPSSSFPSLSSSPPLTLLLAAPPTTAAAMRDYLEACRVVQADSGAETNARPLSCACLIATMDELDALQTHLAAQSAVDVRDVAEITLLLTADLTYRTRSVTVTTATRLYRWSLRRAGPSPPLRSPSDVMAAQTSLASWNHQQRQLARRLAAPSCTSSPLSPAGADTQQPRPFLGLSGFLLTSRRTTADRQREVAPTRRTYGYYIRQTLRRWGNAVCWAALHSPFLYPLVYVARRQAHRDALVRVTELIQWYIFGGTSFGDDRIYCPRPPGAIAMCDDIHNSNSNIISTEFRLIEEEDLFVIHEGLPIVWQRPTTDEMRGGSSDAQTGAGDTGDDAKRTHLADKVTGTLYEKAKQTTEQGEQVIPLTTDAETLVVVECTVGAKTLYRGLSATISGLKQLRN